MALGHVTCIERFHQGAVILCGFCEGEGREPLRTQLVDVKINANYSKPLPKIVQWHPHSTCRACKGDLIHKVIVEGSDAYLTSCHCWGTGKDPASWSEGIPRPCPGCLGVGAEAHHGQMKRFPLAQQEKQFRQWILIIRNYLAQTRKLSTTPAALRAQAQLLKHCLPNDLLMAANTMVTWPKRRDTALEQDERLANFLLYLTDDGSLNEDHDFIKQNRRARILYYLAIFEKAAELDCQDLFQQAGRSLCYHCASSRSYSIRNDKKFSENDKEALEEIELLTVTGNAIGDVYYEAIGWLIKAVVSHYFHYPEPQTQAALRKGLDLVARARYEQTINGSSHNVSEVDELVELALLLYVQ